MLQLFQFRRFVCFVVNQVSGIAHHSHAGQQQLHFLHIVRRHEFFVQDGCNSPGIRTMVIGLERRKLNRNIVLLQVGQLVNNLAFFAPEQYFLQFFIEFLKVVVAVYFIVAVGVEQAVLVRKLPKGSEELRFEDAHHRKNIDKPVFDGRACNSQFMFGFQPFQRGCGFGFVVFGALYFVEDQKIDAGIVDGPLVA